MLARVKQAEVRILIKIRQLYVDRFVSLWLGGYKTYGVLRVEAREVIPANVNSYVVNSHFSYVFKSSY